MTLGIPRSRRAILTTDSGLWLAAIILSLGWHALWWNWLRLEQAVAGKRAAAQPQVVFLPIAETDEPSFGAPMPVSARSPALFALPVLGSFSDPLLRQTISVRPPLAPPIETRFLPPESSSVAWEPEKGAGDQVWWMSEVASVARAFPLRTEDESVFVPAALTDTIVTVTFDEDLSELHWTRQDLPDLPEVCLTQNWEMIVFVGLGKDGKAKQVLLEKRSPSALFDELLERKLRGHSFTDIRRDGHGRLRIQVNIPQRQPRTSRKEAL